MVRASFKRIPEKGYTIPFFDGLREIHTKEDISYVIRIYVDWGVVGGESKKEKIVADKNWR